jgi:hypothetical protein
MSRKRRGGGAAGAAELEELLAAVAAATTDDEKYRAFERAFATVALPTDGFVVGEPIEVVSVDYDGNPRRGLTATCRGRGGSHAVGLVDVQVSAGSPMAFPVEAYRRWLGVAVASAEPGPRERTTRRHKAATEDVDITGPVDLIVLAVKERGARCRLPGSEREITLRASGLWQLVPGEIVTVRPAKSWSYAGHPYLSGEIEKSRLDLPLLGLAPLAVRPEGDWDPAEEYWCEEGEPLPDWARPIIARGVRRQFEMEQIVPGAHPDEPDLDPIVEASELNAAGDRAEAEKILMGLLAQDLRCLDAHAHLGNFAFESKFAFKDAMRHYEIGVRLGDDALGPDFDGVLPWGLIDNRPFLRCLHGYGLCLWRLGRMAEAAAVFERMLWLNPSDNQGERVNLACVRDGHAWTELEGDVERLA